MKLDVKSREGDLLLRLEYVNGETIIVSGTKLLKVGATRWIVRGLDELVGEGAEAEPRRTASTDPEFLPRVKAYIDRQFNFDVVLHDG